jgi:hypothetical protein
VIDGLDVIESLFLRWNGANHDYGLPSGWEFAHEPICVGSDRISDQRW